MAKGAYVEAAIFESKAYLSLIGIAPQVLMLFMLKRQFEKAPAGKREKMGKKICVNSNCLSLTYIEAKNKYGITQPRFTRAIDELLAKGFLTKKHPGGGYQKDKAVYGLSDKYLKWQPGSVIENRKKDPLQRGFRKPKQPSTCQNIATPAPREEPWSPITSKELPGPKLKMVTERKAVPQNDYPKIVTQGNLNLNRVIPVIKEVI
jgi:hypothetical protein